jgi:hypothetical protein
VITEWRSFLIILWRLLQRAFSESKLLNQPAKLFASSKKGEGNAGITSNNYQILPHVVITFTDLTQRIPLSLTKIA